MDDVTTDVIQYLLPRDSEIKFGFESNDRDLSLKLLAGAAEIYFEDDDCVSLDLGQDFQLPIWKCLSPLLKSKIGCDFIFRGNHYVYQASTKTGKTIQRLFSVSRSLTRSYVFALEKHMKVQIFVNEEEFDFQVTLSSALGLSEVTGFKLFPERKYNLPPCTSFIVNSCNNRPYALNLRGTKRRVKVSLLDEAFQNFKRTYHDHLFNVRMRATRFKMIGPIVLVTGTRNVGKTSLCHYLLNKAIDDGMNPIYIDLDIRRNTNTIPGAISLVEIEGRKYISLTFTHYEKRILHFGSIDIDRNNIQLYYLLLRKMGELMKAQLLFNCRRYFGVIIDMCGSLGEDASAIECAIQSFNIDQVVFIGDKSSYEFLKNSAFRGTTSEFVAKPQNIEPQQERREAKYRDNMIRKYFHGVCGEITSRSVNMYQIKIEKIFIYKVCYRTPNLNPIDARLNDIYVAPVLCEPSIEYNVLAVSSATKIDEHCALTDVKYFVCFIKIDVKKGIANVLSPSSEIVFGGNLLLGDVKYLRKEFYNIYLTTGRQRIQ